MRNGLQFRTPSAAAESHPARADVACFVGFVAPRAWLPPPAVLEQLRTGGWGHLLPPGARLLPARPLPVRLDGFAELQATFERRAVEPLDYRVTDGDGALLGRLRLAIRQEHSPWGTARVLQAFARPVDAAAAQALPLSHAGAWTSAGRRLAWKVTERPRGGSALPAVSELLADGFGVGPSVVSRTDDQALAPATTQAEVALSSLALLDPTAAGRLAGTGPQPVLDLDSGRVLPATVERLGPASLTLGERVVAVERLRWRLGAEVALDLWVQADGVVLQWRRDQAGAVQVGALQAPVEPRAGLIEVQAAGAGTTWESYLAGAVRDFFRHGGLRCYVVPVGVPGVLPADPAAARAVLGQLLPAASASPARRQDWRGLDHLDALPDVAVVCLPDLPSLLGGTPPTPAEAPIRPVPAPAFVECAEPEPVPPIMRIVPSVPAPVVSEADDSLVTWRDHARRAHDLVRSRRPDVQLVLALPLPTPGSRLEAEPLRALLDAGVLGDAGVQGAHLQLVGPWLAGDTTGERPGGLAPPDGLLAALIARGALARGTFLSLRGEPIAGVRHLAPDLPVAARQRPLPMPGGSELCLEDCVCLLEPTARGALLASDVTTSRDPSWRQGGVNRLLGVVLRTARRVGQGLVFEAAGRALRTRLQEQLAAALEGIRQAGGLGRPGGRQPYLVRCDGSTTTAADEEAGRVVVHVELEPVLAIERITVVLAVQGSSIGLVATRGGA